PPEPPHDLDARLSRRRTPLRNSRSRAARPQLRAGPGRERARPPPAGRAWRIQPLPGLGRGALRPRARGAHHRQPRRRGRSARLFTRVAIALHALDGPAELRDAIAHRRCAPQDATLRFNRVIAALLSLVFEAADVAADPTVSRLLVALFNLMQGKEFAGQERAAGAAAFAAGAIGRPGEGALLHLIEAQEACFERFEAFCPPDTRASWRAAQAAMPLAELERLRRKLIAAGQ